jgi:hypothetical protein
LDTKSKKSKPLAAWLCFFLGLNILAGLIFTCLAAVIEADGDLAVLKTPFAGYRNTIVFKQQTSEYFNKLLSLVDTPEVSNTDEETIQNRLDHQQMAQDYLNREGANLRYYAFTNGGLLINNEIDLSTTPSSGIPGYTYIWYYDGQKIQVWDHGKTVDTERLDSGYQHTIANNYPGTSARSANTRVLLAVKDRLVNNPYGHTAYYREQKFISVLGGIYVALAITGVALLAFAFIRRRDKKEFQRKLAAWSGGLWLEVKAFISLLLLVLLTNVSLSIGGINDPLIWVVRTGFISCCICLCCVVLP